MLCGVILAEARGPLGVHTDGVLLVVVGVVARDKNSLCGQSPSTQGSMDHQGSSRLVGCCPDAG